MGDYFDAPFHTTSHKEYFIDYVLGDYGHVLLGNDHPCGIFNIGTIKVKLPNGGQWVFKEARKFSNLVRILISKSKVEKKDLHLH